LLFYFGSFNLFYHFYIYSHVCIVWPTPPLHFLKLSNSPLCVYSTLPLPSHPVMDTWIASAFWPLWIRLLRTWICK
jgi:hypothetical protein